MSQAIATRNAILFLSFHQDENIEICICDISSEPGNMLARGSCENMIAHNNAFVTPDAILSTD